MSTSKEREAAQSEIAELKAEIVGLNAEIVGLNAEIVGLKEEREANTSDGAMKIALLNVIAAIRQDIAAKENMITAKENRLTELLAAQTAAAGNYTNRSWLHFMCLHEWLHPT